MYIDWLRLLGWKVSKRHFMCFCYAFCIIQLTCYCVGFNLSIPICKWVPWSAVVKIAAFHWPGERRSLPGPVGWSRTNTTIDHLNMGYSTVLWGMVCVIIVCGYWVSLCGTAVTEQAVGQVQSARSRARDWRAAQCGHRTHKKTTVCWIQHEHPK